MGCLLSFWAKDSTGIVSEQRLVLMRAEVLCSFTPFLSQHVHVHYEFIQFMIEVLHVLKLA